MRGEDREEGHQGREGANVHHGEARRHEVHDDDQAVVVERREDNHQVRGDVADEAHEEARGAEYTSEQKTLNAPSPPLSVPSWNAPWTNPSTPSENTAPPSTNRFEDLSGRKVGPTTNKGLSHYSQSKKLASKSSQH